MPPTPWFAQAKCRKVVPDPAPATRWACLEQACSGVMITSYSSETHRIGHLRCSAKHCNTGWMYRHNHVALADPYDVNGVLRSQSELSARLQNALRWAAS